MTEDQRELLLKAQQSLEAAKLLLTNGFPDYATSRAYYAMFYTAEAFLEHFLELAGRMLGNA